MDPARTVYQALVEHGVDFFTGVPDSLLAPFCAHVVQQAAPAAHLTAVNEGTAVALAAGHHLATGRLGLVYMQNSGLGNAVNPLLSLAHEGAYAIPMVLMVGWRGRPGTEDEPQHRAQGAVTLEQLRLLDIPSCVLEGGAEELRATAGAAARGCASTSMPHALVVPRETFGTHRAAAGAGFGDAVPSRAEVIAAVASWAGDQAVLVATTGHAGRELDEWRRAQGAAGRADFLNVGAMGHASSLALVLALRQAQRRVCCLDGDGALLMHLGALAAIGQAGPANLVHVVLSNGVHDSVGGQATAAPHLDVAAVASACGYRAVARIAALDALAAALAAVGTQAGPVLLDVQCRPGARAGLTRPQASTQQRKKEFMRLLQR